MISTSFDKGRCAFALITILLMTYADSQHRAIGQTSAQATFELPPPTGPHKTGRMSFHWKDAARDELETKKPDDKRELMVHLFYPTDTKVTGARAAYIPDAQAMRGPWNDDQMKRITAMRAFSIENAPLLRGDAKYPVVLFAPGGGAKALTYQTLFEDLASHGWVVATIDPPYNARAVRFPDGRVLGNLPPAERGWPEPRNGEEGRRYYTERIVHWCSDVSFVIDQLTALDRGNGPFAKRLDLQRGVGVFGHSRGGQAAAAVRLLEPRVRSGINLDGMLGEQVIVPVKGADDSGKQAFLWILKPPRPPTDDQLQRAGRTRAEYDARIESGMSGWRRQLSSIAGGAIYVQINRPDVEHMDFSDEPFWDGNMTTTTRPGRLQTIADTRQWVRAFFDGTVRGDWTSLKRLTADKQPQVTVHTFGKLWP